eukprot:12912050-Prorocentrum_lima.AAC.1
MVCAYLLDLQASVCGAWFACWWALVACGRSVVGSCVSGRVSAVANNPEPGAGHRDGGPVVYELS